VKTANVQLYLIYSISTNENPDLQIKRFTVVNICVAFPPAKTNIIAMQTHKKLITIPLLIEVLNTHNIPPF
jgi:hypothetical protein